MVGFGREKHTDIEKNDIEMLERIGYISSIDPFNNKNSIRT
jgi:hypothetical protein